MQTLSPSAPGFSIEKHISTAAQSITAAERKQLVAINEALGKHGALAELFSPARMGQPHPLDEQIQLAEIALSEKPSEEAALELHSLIVRKHEAKVSGEVIAGAIRRKVSSTIDELIPLSIGIIDKAEESFLAEADAYQKATKTETTFATATADFAARLEASKAQFAAKRKWMIEENASAHFLILELGLLA